MVSSEATPKGRHLYEQLISIIPAGVDEYLELIFLFRAFVERATLPHIEIDFNDNRINSIEDLEQVKKNRQS